MGKKFPVDCPRTRTVSTEVKFFLDSDGYLTAAIAESGWIISDSDPLTEKPAEQKKDLIPAPKPSPKAAPKVENDTAQAGPSGTTQEPAVPKKKKGKAKASNSSSSEPSRKDNLCSVEGCSRPFVGANSKGWDNGVCQYHNTTQNKSQDTPAPKFSCCGKSFGTLSALVTHEGTISHMRASFLDTKKCPVALRAGHESGACPILEGCPICAPPKEGKSPKPKPDDLAKKNPLGLPGLPSGKKAAKEGTSELPPEKFEALLKYFKCAPRPSPEEWECLDPASKKKVRQTSVPPKWALDAVREDSANLGRIQSGHLTSSIWKDSQSSAKTGPKQVAEATSAWQAVKAKFKAVPLLDRPRTAREKAFRKKYDALKAKYPNCPTVFPKLGKSPDGDAPKSRGRSPARTPSSSRALSQVDVLQGQVEILKLCLTVLADRK
jgi:hypothetical protein